MSTFNWEEVKEIKVVYKDTERPAEIFRGEGLNVFKRMTSQPTLRVASPVSTYHTGSFSYQETVGLSPMEAAKKMQKESGLRFE